MPESFPSCFGNHNSSSNDHEDDEKNTTDSTTGADSDLKIAQNSVVCMYQSKLQGPVSVTWFKTLLGQGFNVSIDSLGIQHACKVEMRPWLFWKKRGSKAFIAGGKALQLFWDFSNAKFTSGPEPCEGFYVIVLYDREIVLFLGDMCHEAMKKHGLGNCSMALAPTLLSRKEHLFGKRAYHTRAQFSETGPVHDLSIECHASDRKEPWMCLRVDKHVVLNVRHLAWRFRGNHTIHVDGVQVEVLWDAYNWLFNPSCAYAIFMFKTSTELGKTWSKMQTKSAEWPVHAASGSEHHKGQSWDLMMDWHNTQAFKALKDDQGFSLVMHLWRSE